MFDHINAIVTMNEIGNGACQRKRPNAQVIGSDSIRCENIAGFNDGVMRRAVGNDADRIPRFFDDGGGDETARRFVFTR